LHKMATEQLLKDDSSIAKMQVISDSELDRRITEQEVPSEKQKAIPVTPLWGLYETVLIKKCIDEVVENFFASPRDDIELTLRLSRRDMFPRLHVELAPIYQDLHIEAGRFQQNALTPFHIKNRRWRFDDLLRTEDINDNLPSKDLSMQSMESRSASICYAQSSDATTARSPSYDYLSSAYSYLVAFVKVSPIFQ
uniref:Apt1 domain-containing protein n=1 Tax=Brugia timori TaxID=42155 RepID=A0A0R3QWT3_9BILA